MLHLFIALLSLLLAPSLYAAELGSSIVGKPVSSDPITTGSVFQLILMLLLVIGLILFAAWFFRRLGQFGGTNNQAIRYLGGISVGQRERVVLIEVGDTQLLIGVAPGRVEKLHKLDVPVEFDAVTTNSPFAQKLATLVNKKENQK